MAGSNPFARGRLLALRAAAGATITAIIVLLTAAGPAGFGLAGAAATVRTAPSQAGYKYYVVQGTYRGQPESLPEIAAKTLGDSRLSTRIFQLNVGRLQPDGSRLEDPGVILPGWVLILPPNASGPDVRYGPLPPVPVPLRSGTPEAATPTPAAVTPGGRTAGRPGPGSGQSALITAGGVLGILLVTVLFLITRRRRLFGGFLGGRQPGDARVKPVIKELPPAVVTSGLASDATPLPVHTAPARDEPANDLTRQNARRPPNTPVDEALPDRLPEETDHAGFYPYISLSPMRDTRPDLAAGNVETDGPLPPWPDPGSDPRPTTRSGADTGLRADDDGTGGAAEAASEAGPAHPARSPAGHDVFFGRHRIQVTLTTDSSRLSRYLAWAPLPYSTPDGGVAFACVGSGEDGCLFLDFGRAPGMVTIGGDRRGARRLAESIALQLCGASDKKGCVVVVVGDALPRPHPVGATWMSSYERLGAAFAAADEGTTIVFGEITSEADAAALNAQVRTARGRFVPVIVNGPRQAAWSLTAVPLTGAPIVAGRRPPVQAPALRADGTRRPPAIRYARTNFGAPGSQPGTDTY